MKKIFLLAVLLFQLTFVFGQERGYKKTNWSSYRSFPCFPNLQISIRSVGYDPVVKKYDYQWKVKNTSSQTIHFDLGVIIKKSNEEIIAGQFSVGAGKEYIHVSSYANAEPEPNAESFFSSTITRYYENDRTDWTLPSYSCNNGVKVCVANCNTKSPIKGNNSNTQNNNTTSATNSNSNTTNQTTNTTASTPPQNDLTEYNRSKADLERQMQEKNQEIATRNAEAQRQQALLKQLQEQQRQQYNNTVNQANSNLQNGNYTGAMQSYAEAAKNAATKSEKNLAVTGAIASGIGGMFDAIAKAKEEKRERERLEQAQREQRRIEQERIEQQATNLMEQNWQTAINFAKEGEYSQAIILMLPYLNANKINAYSTGLIGFWYYNIMDYKSAKICYEKALKIDKKCCAMHYMGLLYEEGLGVEMNLETALSYYKQSNENGDETGIKNYAKLKPIVEELRKVKEEIKANAKITISGFNFKPHVDYLISQLEAQGFMFNNVTYFCTQEFSKNLSIDFLKNNQKLVTTLQIKYDGELNLKMFYNVNDSLRNDFSKLQLTALIGDEKINNSLSNGSFVIASEVKDTISVDAFKNSKYKGFEQETSLSNEETMEAYLHNYNISCSDNKEKIKWLEKIVALVGDKDYLITLEELYKLTGDTESALKTFSNYVSKISNTTELNVLAQGVKASIKNNLDNYTFNKLIVLAETGNAVASYEIAEAYRRGEISGESKRTSANSVSVPLLRVEKNWEKAVKYYTNAYEGNVQKGYAACSISKLYDEGGNSLEKNSKLHREWKNKAKEADYKCK